MIHFLGSFDFCLGVSSGSVLEPAVLKALPLSLRFEKLVRPPEELKTLSMSIQFLDTGLSGIEGVDIFVCSRPSGMGSPARKEIASRSF